MLSSLTQIHVSTALKYLTAKLVTSVVKWTNQVNDFPCQILFSTFYHYQLHVCSLPPVAWARLAIRLSIVQFPSYVYVNPLHPQLNLACSIFARVIWRRAQWSTKFAQTGATLKVLKRQIINGSLIFALLSTYWYFQVLSFDLMSV